LSDTPITLLASSADDVPVLSALVQDAIIRAGDVGFDRAGRRLVLIASRFRWEAGDRSRVRSGLRIETVGAVQHQGWPRDAETRLALLSVTADGDTHVSLAFAGGTSLRAEVECIDLVLEDLSAPWEVRHRPEHG
jgi:hypothetical protein